MKRNWVALWCIETVALAIVVVGVVVILSIPILVGVASGREDNPQSPRSHDIQSPRSHDIQAPRHEDRPPEAPRALFAQAAPQYPFENATQWGGSILGWDAAGLMLRACPNGTLLTTYRHQKSGDPDAAEWQTYTDEKTLFLGAYYGSGPRPEHILIGTIHADTFKLTVTRTEPFDPSIHQTPCQLWDEKEAAHEHQA